MQITVCGGGGLGHTCSAILSTYPDVVVNLLTNHPEKRCKSFVVNDPDGNKINGKLNEITKDPKKAIDGSDIILLCLPSFLVEDTILQLKPYLKDNQILGTVVANSGFFVFCHKHLSSKAKLFGLQRVPYVSRVVEYGKQANLLGYRSELFMAVENIDDAENFRTLIEAMFGEKTSLVDTFYEVTLSNSNPILHTGRLYTMFKDWDETPFDHCILFYHEWTDEASEIEIKMDAEFFTLLDTLRVDTSKIETLLAHYESTDAKGMTRKLKSIQSLSTIQSPMIEVPGGWEPDFSSRYFTEDFPYGLRMIHDLAHENGVEVPTIDLVYNWGLSKIKQND